MVALTAVCPAYLLYLGIANLRHAPTASAHGGDDQPAAKHPVRFLRRGIGVSTLNPKSLLFFVAFLPQFTHPTAAWPIPAQLAVLGALWATIATITYAATGFTAQHAFGRSPRLQHAVSIVAGVAMILAGIGLLGEHWRTP
jgi:threonine/homoserine/homoserine lactone efflux protein